MYYFDIDDFTEAFGSDDLPLNESDLVETQKVELAIERAEREAHSYLRSAGIKIPLADENAIQDVKGAILDIARLYVNDDHATDPMKERYERAIDYLKSIASGKTILISNEVPAPAQGFFNVYTLV